jgi:hypothetical protein
LLLPNTSAVFKFSATVTKVNQPGILTFIFRVQSDQNDPDSSNNTASVQITVAASAADAGAAARTTPAAPSPAASTKAPWRLLQRAQLETGVAAQQLEIGYVARHEARSDFASREANEQVVPQRAQFRAELGLSSVDAADDFACSFPRVRAWNNSASHRASGEREAVDGTTGDCIDCSSAQLGRDDRT